MTSLATGRMTENVKVWLVSWEASPGRFPPFTPHLSSLWLQGFPAPTGHLCPTCGYWAPETWLVQDCPGSAVSKNLLLPIQELQSQSLVREDSTCHGAAKPTHHSYWGYVLQLQKPTSRALTQHPFLCRTKLFYLEYYPRPSCSSEDTSHG